MINPEKSLAKLWPSLVAEFWTLMRDQASTPALAAAYDREAALVHVPPEKRKEYQGQEIHVGVTGIKKMCPKCLRQFEHVHPSEDSFCPCEWPPVRLQVPEQMMKVMDSTFRFYMKNRLPMK